MTSNLENIVQNLEVFDNGEEYLVTYQEKYFSIDRFLYDIIYYLKYNPDQENIEVDLNLDKNEIDYVLSNIEDQFGKIEPQKKSNYIYFTFSIFSKNIVNNCANFLKQLIPASLYSFYTILVSSFICFGIISYQVMHLNGAILSKNPTNIIYIYISLLFATIFHEFGHASAAKKFNIIPGEIGFGIFFIFPVFYSNVTSIWGLPKAQRIVVNLAGIYFQLIFTFIVTLIFFREYTFLKSFYAINIAIISFSLYPFMKNDGYWVLSDYFNKKNLYDKANSYLFNLFRRKEQFDLFYFIYSLLHIILMSYLLYSFAISSYYGISKLLVDIKALNVISCIQLILNLVITVTLFLRFKHFFKLKK